MTATLKSTRCGRPWVDAANVELQGRPRHDRNDFGETPDKPQRWEQTGGAAVSTLETFFMIRSMGSDKGKSSAVVSPNFQVPLRRKYTSDPKRF